MKSLVASGMIAMKAGRYRPAEAESSHEEIYRVQSAYGPELKRAAGRLHSFFVYAEKNRSAMTRTNKFQYEERKERTL